MSILQRLKNLWRLSGMDIGEVTDDKKMKLFKQVQIVEMKDPLDNVDLT